MTGRRLLPNSDAFGGGMGTVSAWGGSFGWTWTPNVAEGRSGYWRLFFTQLQEEALKQYEEKTGKSVEHTPGVASVESLKKAATKKRRAKRMVEEHVPEVPELPLVLAPVRSVKSVGELLSSLVTLPASNDPQVLAVLSAKVVELRISKQRREQRRRAAMFLLLAA